MTGTIIYKEGTCLKTMKRRTDSGAVCEQIVYNVPDNIRNLTNYDPERVSRDRFESKEEYEKFKTELSRRKHYRNFQANFSTSSLYSTLTFDDEYEVHTFAEAKQVRKNFIRVLKRAYPDAVIFLYMGRGKSTHRIHFHMVSEGIPEGFISEKWKYGKIKRISHLREHCYYEGVDHGPDYQGLASYLFDHWTEEVGGHRWFQTKNARKPEREEPTEVKIRGGYSEKRPPRAPKGYKLVETRATKYGYLYFKYVAVTEKRKKKKMESTGKDAG